MTEMSFSAQLLDAAAVIVRHADCIGADALRIVGLLKDAADCVASDDLRGTDGCLRKRETINAAKQVTAIAQAAVELDHKVRAKLAAS